MTDDSRPAFRHRTVDLAVERRPERLIAHQTYPQQASDRRNRQARAASQKLHREVHGDTEKQVCEQWNAETPGNEVSRDADRRHGSVVKDPSQGMPGASAESCRRGCRHRVLQEVWTCPIQTPAP
jgi:hypothetical protein